MSLCLRKRTTINWASVFLEHTLICSYTQTPKGHTHNIKIRGNFLNRLTNAEIIDDKKSKGLVLF